jgi:hypothetical protein
MHIAVNNSLILGRKLPICCLALLYEKEKKKEKQRRQ